MIKYLFHDDRVTRDELFATGAAFTVVAWAFAYLYSAAQVLWPDSFTGASRRRPGVVQPALPVVHHLTSVGLSDVVPIGAHARSLVMVEQVAGVLYVALVVARLVGLTVAPRLQPRTALTRQRPGRRPSPRGGPAWASCRRPGGRTRRRPRAARRRGSGEGEGVPARAPDVAHHRGQVGVAVEPLVGDLAGRAALDPDGVGAEEREDLAPLPRADLDHRVVVLLPGVVRPGAGLGQAVRLHLLRRPRIDRTDP